MKVGSLFSGIGGIDLGLKRAGMEIIWQVEFDPYCQKVLQKHWPEVPCYGNIKEIDFTQLEYPDLLCGGFPCQPVSHAGKRQGDQDERWLWPEFYRAICQIKPRWILVENVPGLLSFEGGRLFSGILRDLAASGYNVEWDMLSAAAFGAPHLRFRVFIVAHASSGGCLGANPNQREHNAERQPQRPNEEKFGEFGKRDSQDRNPNGGNGDKGQVKEVEKGENPQPTGICPDVPDPTFRCNRQIPQSDFREIPGCDEALSSNPNTIRRDGWAGVFGKGRRREFTNNSWAVEPDVGRVAHGIPSRVDRLKCLGNAVVPQVAEWIGCRIMEVEND